MDDELASVIKRVPLLSDAAWLEVVPLVGGLTNVSYRVTIPDGSFAVRVSGENVSVLGLDRYREQLMLTRAVTAGLAPETVAVLQPEGHTVAAFIDAVPHTMETFVQPDHQARVARALRDVHALALVDAPHHDPYRDIERWLQIIDSRSVQRPVRLAEALDKTETMRQRRAGRFEPVMCHNDPHPNNVLDDGDRLWLIDWEYAGVGDPFFDFAGVARHLTPAQRDHFLACAVDEPTCEDRTDLDGMVDVFLTWNIIWSLLQVTDSKVADFDFAEYAEVQLDQVVPASKRTRILQA